MRNEITAIKLSKKYLWITLGILGTIFLSYAVRMTPYINSYWINFVTALVVNNTFSLLIIGCLSFALFIIEVKIYRKKVSERGDS
ncbi:hypothetical protein DW220_07385 [Eubacterium sp. AM18-26]|nr:hypothetical protein DW220_07385 [Eubacterium sp. AM18-26]RHO25539.1 hypothetical protein DW212_07365 [Eubacterium sp. AM18-10LB-B]